MLPVLWLVLPLAPLPGGENHFGNWDVDLILFLAVSFRPDEEGCLVPAVVRDQSLLPFPELEQDTLRSRSAWEALSRAIPVA